MSDQTSPFPIKPFRFGVQSPEVRIRRRAGPSRLAGSRPTATTSQRCPTTSTNSSHRCSALQAVLDGTTTLRAGALVFDNDYKHPLVLAKELATMDVLSDGRVEIGLGAGWMIADYEQAGMTYDRAGVRIDRFVEGLAVIKGVMGAEPFSFDGEHYTIRGHDGFPKPVQRPHPPVIIGGGGHTCARHRRSGSRHRRCERHAPRRRDRPRGHLDDDPRRRDRQGRDRRGCGPGGRAPRSTSK